MNGIEKRGRAAGLMSGERLETWTRKKLKVEKDFICGKSKTDQAKVDELKKECIKAKEQVQDVMKELVHERLQHTKLSSKMANPQSESSQGKIPAPNPFRGAKNIVESTRLKHEALAAAKAAEAKKEIGNVEMK